VNRWILLGLLGCLLATTNAIATERSVSDIHIVMQDWELVPTFIGTQVESILGLRNESTAIGNNITAIWFLRLSDQRWQAYAWYEQDNVKSIAHVKSILQLDDTTDAYWPDPNAQLGGTIHTTASSLWLDPYGSANGMFGPTTPGIECNALGNCPIGAKELTW